MAQRFDITKIYFQADARAANAAVESMRKECERCQVTFDKMKADWKAGINANLPQDQVEKLRKRMESARKELKQFSRAYKELIKGNRALAEGIKSFNDGTLGQQSAAFLKTVNRSADLAISKLNKASKSYKQDRAELEALSDASEQFYARYQADVQHVIKTIRDGSKVSRNAIETELKQQRELLSVLAETDDGYKKVEKQVAILDHYLKAMGGSYAYIRQNIQDTKKVSDETLRNMYKELEQTNNAGKVTTRIMRENKAAMREIRAEQARRVQNVLGGDLGKQSEASIRGAIASAKELIQVYGTSSKKAQTLAQQIVNAEEYLKTVGVEGARAAKRQADEAQVVADKYKLMQDRMGNLNKLSQAGLTETQKYWQAQLDGATKGSRAYREAERNLKAINAEQQRLTTAQLQKSANLLGRKNLGTLSVQELQSSINAAKQLAASMKTTDPAYKLLINNIIRADEYLKLFGLDGQRSAKQVADRLAEMNSRMSRITSLSDGALEETRKFWQEQMNGAERGSKAYKQYEANMRAVEERQRKIVNEQNRLSANKIMSGRISTMSEGELRAAIAGAREYQKTLQNNTKAYNDLAVATAKADEYLKRYGAEAAAQMGLMTSRLSELSSLSKNGLAESQKYWQAQLDGARRGTAEYQQAETALKQVNEQLKIRNTASAMRTLAKPGNYGDTEIRNAIAAMEKLRDEQAHGSQEWNRYNRLVQQGKAYLEEWGRVDSVMKFEAQMKNLTTLSDNALAETRKFWQSMVDGTAKGDAALAGYEAQLKKVIQEEAERRQLSNEMAVQKLGGNLKQLSEGEIRQAIEAGKQLIQTYETASPEAQRLAKQIVNAEEHLKKYGIEAERAAAREANAVKKAADERMKADKLMQDKLRRGTALSEAALKAQQQYWQRLINDPKTASSSLAQYEANLQKVQMLQKQMVANNGSNALAFFRNGIGDASAEQIKQAADALKQWRDMLPTQSQANLIAEIDSYLKQAGQSAGNAAKPAMELQQAINIGMAGLNRNFTGTNEQLRQAKASLEAAFATVKKGTPQYEQLRRALQGIALEEKNVGRVTQEIDAILSKPKGRSFNELKLAVEEGRKALNSMDRTTTEGQARFDELAKKIKATDFEMKQLQGTSKGTASAFDKAWSRLKTYITLYMGTAVAIQKLVATMGDLMTLSDKMGEVRKTTGFTADQVGKLSDNLARMDTRTPLTKLMELSAAAGQLGLNTEEDVRGFTEAANMMLVALPEMGQDGATQMLKVALATGEITKIQKQMQQGTIEGSSATAVAMEKIASTIDRLRATTAAAAPPITDFVKRVGAVGAQSGISIDQVAALGATVDSLGMGTEMAATALSRMIPAIKNNAFDIAQAIGVTPNTIRELFDTGRGMEAILMIFQHIKDAGMNADSVDKLLNMGGMQEIMKELNQQGARAGIVFAGLSQNVDELRKNLGTAHEAYEEGTAIMDEYNKMNDTLAGKWARLKNQVEEFFVSDANQRGMGHIVDFLRTVVDLLTGSGGISVALRSIVLYLSIMKTNLIVGGLTSIWNGLRNIAISLKVVKGEMTKMQMANIWTAIAAAVLYAVYAFTQMKSAADIASEALGKAKEEVRQAEERFEGYWKTLQQTDVALRQAQASHRELSREVDILRNMTDKGTHATELLSKKEKELKDSEKSVEKATNDRRTAINNINAIYGKYLGFILTERNYSLLAADAHNKVAAAIEREMLMKQKQAAIDEVDSKYTSDIAEDYGKLNERLISTGKLNRNEASKAMRDLQKFMRQNVEYDSGTGKATISNDALNQLRGAGIQGLRDASANEIVGVWFNKYLKDNYHVTGKALSDITGIAMTDKPNKGRLWWSVNRTGFANNLRANYAQTFIDRKEEEGAISEVFDADLGNASKDEAQAANNLLKNLKQSATAAKNTILNRKSSAKQVSNAYEDLANALEGLQNRMDELDPNRDKGEIAQLQAFADNLNKTKAIDKNRLRKAQQNVHSTLFDRATLGDDNGIGSVPYVNNVPVIDPGETHNPWGETPDAASTDWKKMNAKELVARRKQMNDFVKALQEDTDVQSVLAEDPALKKAIEKGMKSDMRTVVNWYNTERLKIQDELHARFLTNTGNWKDPSNKHAAKKAQKMVNDEIKYYLDELDAYYTERKARIEQAQADGDIDEAEAWRRTLQNDQEWQQRRGELQQMYTEKRKGVAKSEADAIYAILDCRTGEGVEAVQQNIASTIRFIQQIGKEKGLPAMKRVLGDLEKAMEQSFQKSQAAVAKQMAAIAEIISKERPFDGIVQNLRQNVEKMGVIQGDFEKRRGALLKAATVDKDALAALDDEQAREVNNRLTFLLGEAENAYTMTWEKLQNDMQEKGYTSWLDALTLDDGHASERQEALLAQLRTVYDAVQDAIKKEASQVKKQVEIQWNDVILPGNMSMKSLYEKTASALGVEEGRVNRANNLIGAGNASARVADKLAIKQMQIQLDMQTHYYNLVRKIGQQRVDNLKLQAAEARAQGDLNKAAQLELDAKHAQMSLNLSLSEEESALAKQREDIIARTEESENRLYTDLREWASLLTSSLQSMFEASNTGLPDYYNNLAKMRLTGEGSAGGTYVIIENAGTKDAEAHYETLDGEDALRRQLEIDQQNAVADAWKKVMDDINAKINDAITDWVNSAMQTASIDANTLALEANTRALYATIGGGSGANDANEWDGASRDKAGMAVDDNGNILYPIQPENPEDMPRAQRKRLGMDTDGGSDEEAPSWKPFWQMSDDELEKADENIGRLWTAYKDYGVQAETEKAEALAETPGYAPLMLTDDDIDKATEQEQKLADKQKQISDDKTQNVVDNANKEKKATEEANKKEASSTQSSFAKMAQAANLYGIAYQTMSNDNLSASQKWQLFAVQAAGQAAITMLTTDLAQGQAKNMVQMPGILGKLLGEMPYPAAIATYAAITALMGGLMALAVSKVSKSKSEIAQATGSSVGAGRLSTGMLTYAEGNVNEFTDPSTLTPGKNYNVDAADGRTYRAKYTGNNPKTHITNGPEFHLAGERGREAIIDAHTTRLLQMDDTGIWQSIQTLYNGGGLRALRNRRGRGVRAFAEGNIDDFNDVALDTDGTEATYGGMSTDMVASLQASLDRNTAVMERAVSEGIKGVFNVYGKGGLVDSYDSGKKQVTRHGERY